MLFILEYNISCCKLIIASQNLRQNLNMLLLSLYMHKLRTVQIYFECTFSIFIIITDLVCNTCEHTQWRIALHKMDQLYFGQICYNIVALNIHHYCEGSYGCENSHILLTGFDTHSNSYNHIRRDHNCLDLRISPLSRHVMLYI